jgi:hypothetical protein
MLSVVSSALHYFSTISIKRQDFPEGGIIELKMGVFIFFATFV